MRVIRVDSEYLEVLSFENEKWMEIYMQGSANFSCSELEV